MTPARHHNHHSSRWAQLALDTWISALQACRGHPTVVLPTDLTAPATVDVFLKLAVQQLNAARAVHRQARGGAAQQHAAQQHTGDSDSVEGQNPSPAEMHDHVPAVGLQRRLAAFADQPLTSASQESSRASSEHQRPSGASRLQKPNDAEEPPTGTVPTLDDGLRMSVSADAWEPRIPSYAVLWRHFLRYHGESSHAANLTAARKAAVQACTMQSTLASVDAGRWNTSVPLRHLLDGQGLGGAGSTPVRDAVAAMWPAGCAVDPPLDLKLLVVATEAVLQEVVQRPGAIHPSHVASEILVLHVVLRREWDRGL